MIERELPGARVVFSTREGGVSEGPYESLNLGLFTDDEEGRVVENRRRLAAAAGLEPEAIAMGWQMHGAEVREWTRTPARPVFPEPADNLPRVDGHTTSVEGLGLLVIVADCLPVALSTGERVGMVHCGWRGLAEGVLDRAIEYFDGEAPEAAIGPGIGSCCYEVGEEVLERFEELEGVADGRMLDLRAIARHQLEAGGVERIEHVDLCTSCRPDLFFSHRRDAGVTGRQGGLVWRTA